MRHETTKIRNSPSETESGGKQIDYPGEVSTPTNDLTTAKCLVNSILSTSNAKGMCADITYFYFNTEMNRFEYMKVKEDFIPEEIREQYNLKDVVVDGWMYIEIRKDMFGLPQASLLVNITLKKNIANHGYYPTKYTPSLWKHESKRAIAFILTVDDFFIKYTDKADADHLLNALKKTQYHRTGQHGYTVE